MTKKRHTPRRVPAGDRSRTETLRGDGTTAGAAAEDLLLEMVDFERLTIAFAEAGWMSRSRGMGFRASARQSHRQVLLCLRELAATDPAALTPAQSDQLREWRRTWTTMSRIGRRTLRRLDDMLEGT
jgi:hypothetical protein